MTNKIALTALALALATIFGLATPIHAAKSLTGGASGQASVHRHIASFANGDTGVIGSFDNTCGAWAVSHFVGGGGGGIVEIYGSRSNLTTDGELLATLSTTSALTTVIRTAYPRIVVNINTAPAAGTDAQTYFVCSATASNGGATASRHHHAHYWLQGAAGTGAGSGTFAQTECLPYQEGDFQFGGTLPCTQFQDAFMLPEPAGRGIVARALLCHLSGTVTGTAALEVLWIDGANSANTTASTNALSIPAASVNNTLISTDINSLCPYAATGCLAGVRVRTSFATVATLSAACELELES